MKKATKKGADSTPAKKAPAKRAASPSSKPTKEKTAGSPATAAPAATAPAAVAPAPVKSAPKPVEKKPAAVKVTSVVAQIDVGFGNLLYIRGEGPGLSWDRGTPMENVTADTWEWTSKAVSRPFAYKVLINDEQWSSGEDHVAGVGVKNTIVPVI